MEEKQPRVLIVILNYGTYDLTIKMVEELKAALDYENYSIIVIDNDSPNESPEVLSKMADEKGFIFCANKTNAGYAAGNNIGIRFGIEHGFDYSWILNNDVELREKNVLSHMVHTAEGDPSIGCVGPKIFSLRGTPVAPYCRRQSFWQMTIGVFAEKKYRQKHLEIAGTVYCVYGCCMLLKNTVMDEIHCMDERTFLYGEENILAERLLAKGYTTYYDPAVSVTHHESSSVKQLSSNQKEVRIRQAKKSRELYLKEYRHFAAPMRWMCHMTRKIITGLRG